MIILLIFLMHNKLAFNANHALKILQEVSHEYS